MLQVRKKDFFESERKRERRLRRKRGLGEEGEGLVREGVCLVGGELDFLGEELDLVGGRLV